MNPTLEEVKKVAIECGMAFHPLYDKFRASQLELQAFAQHYKEEGRKEQRDSDASICENAWKLMNSTFYGVAEAIRNNTGE